VFNLGNHHTVSLNEMIGGLEDVLGVTAKRKPLPLQDCEVPQTYADIRKAGRLLGYHPETSFPEGLARFAAWLRAERRPGAAAPAPEPAARVGIGMQD
jgi:UDP-glucuronate 4-epimerase